MEQVRERLRKQESYAKAALKAFPFGKVIVQQDSGSKCMVRAAVSVKRAWQSLRV